MSTQHAPPARAGATSLRLATLWLGACIVCATATPAQQALPPAAPATPTALEPVVLFAGVPGGVGSLEVYDARTGAPLMAPGRLRDLRLLPVDHTGRTQHEQLLPERPRRIADLPGAATRLALPFGTGSLYRYVRSAHGALRYGFLVVRPGAMPRVALELAGHGPLYQDPFIATVGVAPDARSFLVATTLAAGGDLYEVPLVEAPATLRTAAVPPQAFSPDSLWLGREFGFGIAPTGAWRFPRVPGGAATAVAVPAGTTWTGQVVMNRPRLFALATTGADPLQRSAWVFGAAGPAVRASVAAAEIADAGFQPQHAGGPWMALSDDGTLAAWAETTVVTTAPLVIVRDVRLQRVQSALPGPVVTGDSYLLDTLDEIGRMGFYRPTELTYAAGEVNGPAEGGLATADFFGASLGPNDQPVLRNLSVTSGDPSVPFTGGVPTITPATAHTLGGQRYIVIHDDNAEELQLLDVVAGGLTVLETDVKDLHWFEPVGDWYCAAIRRRNGQRQTEVVRFRRDFSSALVVVDPGSQDHEFLFPVVRGGTLTWVESVLASQRLERATVDVPLVETWSPSPGVFTPPLALGASGDVRFARAAVGVGVESRVWRVGAPDIVLQHPVRPGHWLP